METPKNKELQFKPLSSGLGFHPFAEGLPYADENQKLPTRPLPSRPASMNAPKSSIAPRNQNPSFTPETSRVAASAANAFGVGAVAAGKPTFVKPTSLTPQTKRGLNETFGIAFPQQAQLKQSPASPTLAKPGVQPIIAPAVAPMATNYDFSYCVKRSLAYLLDTALNVLVCGMALFVTFWKQNLGFKVLEESGTMLWVAGFLILFNWALITAQEVLFGTTTGKKIFGLAIFATPSTILVRSIFFLMGLALGGLGVLWALIHPTKRGWHDIVADVQPEEIAIL